MSNNVINGDGFHYDPYFYANNALALLEKNLLMAGSVYRDYDRNVQTKGSVINIRKPDTFAVTQQPGTAQDISPENVQITLDQWWGDGMALTDKELSLSADQIINEHIYNMAYALAEHVDTHVLGLSLDVPWFVDVSSTPDVRDITRARKQLAKNKVRMNPNDLFLFLDPDTEEGYLSLLAFSQNQGAGATGVSTQETGELGRKFGFKTAMSQNMPTHTAGTASTTTLAANGAYPIKNAQGIRTTSVNLDAGTVTGTLKKGDVISFAGHSQKYAVTGTVTAAGNAFVGVGISPGLQAAVADNEVVTVIQDSHVVNLAFHREAFALATAPLSTMGGEIGGVRMATVTRNNITMRSTIGYSFQNKRVEVNLDVLYGLKTLDPNKAVRLRGAIV